jgi:hypothetical protein
MSLSARERGKLGAAARWAKAAEAAVVEELIGLSEPAAKEKAGIERELRVIRVGPNPRMITCEYWELAQRRTCVVNVGRSKKYLCGMRFKMVEPVVEAEYERPWVYRGIAPRRKGRW